MKLHRAPESTDPCCHPDHEGEKRGIHFLHAQGPTDEERLRRILGNRDSYPLCEDCVETLREEFGY